MKYILMIVCGCLAAAAGTKAQDAVYVTNIRTPQLFVFGNQVSLPVMRLNSADQLELHFDDLDADVKAYSYTFQLYNADWTPALLSEFDYIRGFSQIRISDYRLSSVALTKYTHYRAILPDRSCIPTRSGNYVLKVFLDGDTSKLVFTRRFLVVGNSANVAAEFLQPFNPQVSRTHQKIQLVVNTRSLDINNASQQVKVWVLQNNRWDNAIHDIQPSFSSGNTIEYNSDDGFVFPGGNEWRWLDLQGNFHFQSDRIQKGIYGNTATELLVKPDLDRSKLPYYNYRDYNGTYFIQTTESIRPLWQTDYATIDFFFSTPDHAAFADKDIYVFGALSGYALDDSMKMKFNESRGMYEASLFLKQGYYDYSFVTIDPHDPARKASFEFTEGNHLETENDYCILVYYRQLGGRADELVAMTKFNSLTGK